ncbi:MAG: sugar phosphate isomerase/epimerase family protein [Bacteroidota bacterium]
MSSISLGIVSDEISNDFEEAVGHGLSWGISQYEIRVLRSGRVPDVEEEEFKKVIQTAREKGVEITALSPGTFKQHLSQRSDLDRELDETLPRTIALAKGCSASLIITFGFQREEGEPSSHYDLAVEYMGRAAAIAEKEGIKLAIENEPGFWADTGVNTLRLIRDVNSSALGANWDPCNAYGTDEVPYPEGYEAIKPAIINVHAKDTLKGALIQCVPVGEGIIDWQGQVQALVRDRIVRHITIETHCHPLVENSQKNVQVLRKMLESAKQ